VAHPPSFPLYVQDFLTGTMALSPAERGMYLDCLCYQWEVGGVPGDDLERLARVMRCTTTEARRAWPVLASKFVKGDDGLYRNARLEAVRDEKRVWHESRRKNGEKGGRPPKQETTEKPSGSQEANLVVHSSSSSSLVPSEPESRAPAGAVRRQRHGDPFGMRRNPNEGAMIDLGNERIVIIPAGWVTTKRTEYGLTEPDIQAFSKWCSAYVQRHGFEDRGKRLDWLDARLADFRQERANPNDGYRPASEWIAERQKRDAEIPEISAERRRELLRPVRTRQA
jgi:uncharacterized protein YdaU (DUF1376 family)